MAFKMKNPGMGKMAKAAGSPAKFGIEHKGIDSAARGTKAIGSDGQPLKMKKDFGMEGSAMKFKGIRDKIAARRVSKNKFVMADDPNYKESDKKRISDEASKGQRNLDNKKQDIAQTGVTKQTKKGKTKEYQVDQDGKVKSLSKVKTRGRKDLELEDGTIKRRGRKVTKTINADGTKRKVITDSSGKVLKDKTSKRKRKQLDKTVSGRAAELKVKKARKREDSLLDKGNKKIKDYNEKELATYNKKIADAEARGGSLAIIDTSLRLDAAQNLLISSGLPLWIGLYDSDQDNSYNWINGNALTVSNFANGQPDVSVERAIRTIGSGEIWGNVGQWMDEDDWKGYGYLLTTVPEPSNYALTLGGLALVLVALRRRL
mgnify:CR=1 FL=1